MLNRLVFEIGLSSLSGQMGLLGPILIGITLFVTEMRIDVHAHEFSTEVSVERRTVNRRVPL
jgi:hypothetical protein